MRLAAASVLLLLAAAPASAGDMPGMDMSGAHAGGTPAPAPGRTPADAAFAVAMDKMMAGMAVKPTGDADRDFATMMIPHHQGAIDMARVELAHGKDPMLRQLAEDIVKAQESEIAAMKAWLAKSGR